MEDLNRMVDHTLKEFEHRRQKKYDQKRATFVTRDLQQTLALVKQVSNNYDHLYLKTKSS